MRCVLSARVGAAATRAKTVLLCRVDFLPAADGAWLVSEVLAPSTPVTTFQPYSSHNPATPAPPLSCNRVFAPNPKERETLGPGGGP